MISRLIWVKNRPRVKISDLAYPLRLVEFPFLQSVTGDQ
jgi:hypothetical protein